MSSSIEPKSQTRDEYSGLGAQLSDALRSVFRLDLRSLATFRIGLGLIIICDLIFRSQTLTEMYTDEGFYTRQVSYDYYQATWGDGWQTIFWSLHWLGGSPAFIATIVGEGIRLSGVGPSAITRAIFHEYLMCSSVVPAVP